MDTLKDRFKKYRDIAGLSQRELGQVANMSQQCIAAVEKGKTQRLRVEQWVSLARALNVSPSTLVFGEFIDSKPTDREAA